MGTNPGGLSQEGKPVVLVDMDNVLADFETGFLAHWRQMYPEAPFVPVAERNTFLASDQLPPEFRQLGRRVPTTPGFFTSLAPIPGGREALEELQAEGFEVFLCTAPPHVPAPGALSEKGSWVVEHLGVHWLPRLVVTSDKTLIRGSFLIDDAPVIKGVAIPTWEHIIFSAPFNLEVTGKRRLDSWSLWRTLLG